MMWSENSLNRFSDQAIKRLSERTAFFDDIPFNKIESQERLIMFTLLSLLA